MNSYLIAILSGVFIYLIMILDSKYIEQTKDSKPISFKIPILVTVLVWVVCTFHETQITEKIPTINALRQDIYVDRF
jgi:hypothetical protein